MNALVCVFWRNLDLGYYFVKLIMAFDNVEKKNQLK